MIDPRKLTRWYDLQAPWYSFWRDRFDSPLVSCVGDLMAPLARPNARVLDLGCGTGLFTVGLSRVLGSSRITGVDLSAGMLSVARRQALQREAKGVELCRAEGGALPFRDGAFDAAVAAGLLPNVNDRPAIFRELVRVLRSGGKLIVVEFDRDSMSLPRRLMFVSMILGYRAVSFFLRRYRFAESWNLRASTIGPGEVEGWAGEAGLGVGSTTLCEGHRIFDLDKRSVP